MGFFFFIFLMALSFGASFWAGYNEAPVLTAFILSAAMAVTEVWAGWRAPKGGTLGSLVLGTCFAATWCIPTYFLGRWLLRATTIWPWLVFVVLLAGVLCFLFFWFRRQEQVRSGNKLNRKQVEDTMAETRSYELTHEQVLEICQALKFRADALDHFEGSDADRRVWARQAASLWSLIDKLVRETPSLRLVPPGSPG